VKLLGFKVLNVLPCCGKTAHLEDEILVCKNEFSSHKMAAHMKAIVAKNIRNI
jgi:hypothetical protein